MRRFWQHPEYQRQIRNERFPLIGGFVVAAVVLLVWPRAPWWLVFAVVFCAQVFTFRVTRRWHERRPSDDDRQRPA